MNGRDLLEQELTHSLSRYIGYTTGAYGIDRFVEILDLFSEKPFVYHFELVDHLKNLGHSGKAGEALTDKYAAGIIDVAAALGLIANAIGDRGAKINPKLAKFELTVHGRSLRAACELGTRDFRKFLLGTLLAENDADLYCLVLEHFSLERLPNLHVFVQDRMLEQRESRIEWINSAISHRFLRDKIVSGISWIKPEGRFASLKQSTIPESFLKHHMTPRKGWAREIGHIDSEKRQLTVEGASFFARLSRNGAYSWVGPGQEAMEKLKIVSVPEGGLIGPPSLLIRGEAENDGRSVSVPSEAELVELRKYMTSAYPYLKLSSANQASIGTIVLYINFMESRTCSKFNTSDMIEKIVKAHSNRFAVMSSRNAKVGYYQLRAKN